MRVTREMLRREQKDEQTWRRHEIGGRISSLQARGQVNVLTNIIANSMEILRAQHKVLQEKEKRDAGRRPRGR